MEKYLEIIEVHGREILDSRGGIPRWQRLLP